MDLIQLTGIGALARRMRRNAGIRVISVIIAIGLWVFVNAGERGAVDAFSVPISYRALPPGLVIINHPTEFTKIEVAGPRTLLSLLDTERLTLRLELAGIQPGQTDIKLTPGMFNVPRGTSVTRIVPDQINVDIDRIVVREIPVHLNLQGQPAAGYEVTSIQLRPSIVGVSGPARTVMPMHQVDTEPLELRGENSDIESRLALMPPAPLVKFSSSRVEAMLDIGERIANREFRGVAVEVRDIDYKYRLQPQKATITVRGPASKLETLDPSGLVYVDAGGGTPGAKDFPVQVELPDGMHLVKQNPDKVKLRIYPERRTTIGDGKAS